jgi:zinc transport system substrate-binding protein
MKKALFYLFLLSSSVFAQISVCVTIFPIYDAAKNVGKDKIALTNLVPFGTEAHEFEPKAKDVAKLSKCDVFITSGEVFEPWSAKIINSLKIKDKTIDMSKKVKLIKVGDQGSYDPHYWLNIENQIAITKEIVSLLSKKDPANSKTYEANGAEYIKKLTTLKAEYEAIRKCKNKKVIVNHDAFRYLSNEYEIKQYSISGMSPDAKPTAKQIANLIEIAKKEKINTVFFEEFASDKVAKTIAKEANIKTDALRPVENITLEESRKNIGYVEIMRSNLQKLLGAMECR